MTLDLFLLTLTAGVVTGLLSSMLGVGGGLIVIPFMLLALDAPQHVAEGTSLAVIVPTAAVGAFFHARSGLVEKGLLSRLLIGGIPGVIAGGLIAIHMDGEVLRNVYTGFVFFMAYRFLKPKKEKD